MTALCMVTPHVSVLPCTIKHATCRQTPHNGGNTPCSDHVHTPHRQSLYTLHTASPRTHSTPPVPVHTPHRQSTHTLHTASLRTHSTPPVHAHAPHRESTYTLHNASPRTRSTPPVPVHTPQRQSLYTLHTASLRTRSTPRVCVHTPHRQSLYTLHTVSPCTHSTPPVPVHKTPECIPTKLLSVTYRTFAGPFCLCEKADVFHIYLPSHLLRSSFRPLLGVQVPLILTSFNSSVC